MALTTSPGLLCSESSEPTRLALIAVPVLNGIVTGGPSWTCFFAGLLVVCPMVPPASVSVIARSATPIILFVIGRPPICGLEDEERFEKLYHQDLVQRQFQSVTPLISSKTRREPTLLSAHFGVLYPSSYRVRAAFLLQIMYRRPADITATPPSGLHPRPIADARCPSYGMIPSGLPISAMMSAALTSCSFLCPALTIARNRAFPSVTVG